MSSTGDLALGLLNLRLVISLTFVRVPDSAVDKYLLSSDELKPKTDETISATVAVIVSSMEGRNHTKNSMGGDSSLNIGHSGARELKGQTESQWCPTNNHHRKQLLSRT